jgi:exonuclease V gamma subunit
MGRYYSGDIEGKFWFAVQDSNAADRFGVQGHEPNYIEYYFSQDDLPFVQEELNNIEYTLGTHLPLLENWNSGKDNRDLREVLGIDDEKKVKKLLKDFADYLLGKQIEQSILEKGQCEFEAEL